MRSELYKAVVAARLSENETLDLLQEAGAISDLCLKLSDVAEVDCAKAISVLRPHIYRHPNMTGKSHD